ncbi:MAG TPA: response regulator [Candidatus Bathyarchaeia archaeon]|nr:response regulator [Candidatus Bathyarchaeia archaeon]
MNQGPNPPSGNAGGKGRRRRRGRRGAAGQQPNQQHGKSQGQGQGPGPGHSQGHGHGQSQGQGKHAGGRRFGKKHSGGRKPGGRPAQREPLGGVYSAPMDHSYRAVLGDHDGNSHLSDYHRGGKPFGAETEAPPIASDAPTRIYAFVDDLFFLAKITETARKLGVKVEFVKTDKDVFERMGQNGNDKPSLIIVDLNNLNAKPLTIIPKLKSKLKKETNIIGFVSHVQGELKMKALEAGCDMVVPRSAFSQNLPQLLRRHTAQDEELPEHGQPN